MFVRVTPVVKAPALLVIIVINMLSSLHLGSFPFKSYKAPALLVSYGLLHDIFLVLKANFVLYLSPGK